MGLFTVGLPPHPSLRGAAHVPDWQIKGVQKIICGRSVLPFTDLAERSIPKATLCADARSPRTELRWTQMNYGLPFFFRHRKN